MAWQSEQVNESEDGGPEALDFSRTMASPRQRLMRQITACWQTQALHVAVKLDLPDMIASGTRDAQAMAQRCDCSAQGLARLLQALCALDVCRQSSDGRFELTSAGASLCREPADGAASMRSIALWWGGPMWSLWGDLDYSIVTGRSARERQTGLPNYVFLERQTELAHLFHQAMQAQTALLAPQVIQLGTWAECHELVDVGGGHGTLAAAIAAAHPHVRITVFDRPEAEAGATALFRQHGLQHRARFVQGDFFANLPDGADRYLLKSILHNWDDQACHRLLVQCARATVQGTKLLIIERARPERCRPTPHDEAVSRADLNMLAGLGGRERSLSEFDQMLDAAGLAIVKVTRTESEFTVIEAIRSLK